MFAVNGLIAGWNMYTRQDGGKRRERFIGFAVINVCGNTKVCTQLHLIFDYNLLWTKSINRNAVRTDWGHTMQEQICWGCGKVIPPEQFYDSGRRFCEKCEAEHIERYKGIVNEYAIAKNKVTFERAMRLMEKAGCEMSKYKRYARAVERHSAENPEQYRSSDEMIAAVVLLEAGFDFEMNKVVGKYTVDIFLPEMCVCLEIDGDRHKYSKKEDGQRDLEIRRKLGSKWEIVRIPTKYIEKEPEKIAEAVQAVYDLKKRTREKNGGILPETYSSSVKAYYDGLGIGKRIRVP